MGKRDGSQLDRFLRGELNKDEIKALFQRLVRMGAMKYLDDETRDAFRDALDRS